MKRRGGEGTNEDEGGAEAWGDGGGGWGSERARTGTRRGWMDAWADARGRESREARSAESLQHCSATAQPGTLLALGILACALGATALGTTLVRLSPRCAPRGRGFFMYSEFCSHGDGIRASNW